MPRPKLVIFDFDGTFAFSHENSGWELIDEVLGCKNEEALLKKKFKEGLIDFQIWSQGSFEIYKEYGLTLQRLEEIVNTYLKPSKGIPEVLTRLDKLGLRTGIISGSISNIYEVFSKRFQVSVEYPRFAAKFNFDSVGNMTGGEFTNYDYAGKVHVLKEICEKCNVSPSEAVMIGNDVNDISVFKAVGLSIAFNPMTEVVAKAANQVVIHDMSNVLKYIES
jgi:phosphoserine phosphatase